MVGHPQRVPGESRKRCMQNIENKEYIKTTSTRQQQQHQQQRKFGCMTLTASREKQELAAPKAELLVYVEINPSRSVVTTIARAIGGLCTSQSNAGRAGVAVSLTLWKWMLEGSAPSATFASRAGTTGLSACRSSESPLVTISIRSHS